MLEFCIFWFLHLRLADIFRPFVGYKEVRLVTKESRHVSTNLYAQFIRSFKNCCIILGIYLEKSLQF